jgi:signal transduction histidine kinase
MGRISELARNLLAFSRGETLRPALTDPATVVREAADLFLERAAQHGIRLDVEIAPQIAPAMLDPEGMRSCLDNLLSNAIDACLLTPEGAGRIGVSLREEDEALIFEVVDTGCGMDYEVKQKAFTSFFTTKGAGGTGLGLLLTRKIVQQHGGSVTFESSPGEGTVFRLVLPRRRLPVALSDGKGMTGKE